MCLLLWCRCNFSDKKDGNTDKFRTRRYQLTICSWNTKGSIVWAWMLWSPCALGTRAEIWFGHGCSGHHMPLEHERNYGLGLEALVTVCSWNTNGILVWTWMLWSPCALGTRAEIWFGHGCSGHCMLLEHEQNRGLGMNALVTVCFLAHERNRGLGMNALVTICSWNTKRNMVWAWMLWSLYALGTRTESWFGHECSGHRMLFGTRKESWFGHECSGHHMLLEHEEKYGLGMDALVTVCSWNTNGSIVWA